MEKIFKRTAIHNIIVDTLDDSQELNEGIVIPESLMKICDLMPYEKIVITKISGDNWKNRITTFVIPGKENLVIVRGSLTKFFVKGDTACIISYTNFSEQQANSFFQDNFPIIDVGFDPDPKKNDITKPVILVEYYSKKITPTLEELEQIIKIRKEYNRFLLSNIVVGLEINNTHPDCLHGSAELPQTLMSDANLKKYQHVIVYNATLGGQAETYSVPMPDDVVMTTGAMAKFAKIGDVVNVSSYIETKSFCLPNIVITDGLKNISKK